MSDTAYVQPISSYLFWYGQAPGQVVIPSKVNYYDTFYQPGPDPDLGSPRTIPEVKTQAVVPTPQAYGAGIPTPIFNLLNSKYGIPATVATVVVIAVVIGAIIYSKKKKKRK